jgi:hypothetical protein
MTWRRHSLVSHAPDEIVITLTSQAYLWACVYGYLYIYIYVYIYIYIYTCTFGQRGTQISNICTNPWWLSTLTSLGVAASCYAAL